MKTLMDYPWVLFLVAMLIMSAAAVIGSRWAKRHAALPEGVAETFSVVQAASLTLLALIVGFSFSMAISRYDQRMNYEEAEANAIGTELARMDLLDAEVRASLKHLLAQYVDQRIAFYASRSVEEIAAVHATQTRIETQLWSQVVAAAEGRRDPITALVVAGMNDVLNSEGYTQAAWWNRIPLSAWFLMLVLGVFANLLVGAGARHARTMPALLLIMPFFVAISLAFIADIDSPRGGLIRVAPHNLVALSASLKE